MRFFRRFRSQSSPQTSASQPEGNIRNGTVIPFKSDALSYIKHHGIRALCGLLMDRHSECRFCPFCGDPDDLISVIVNIITQTDAVSGNPIVALYFTKTTEVQGSDMNVVTDWAPRLRYAEPAPSRKAAVALLDNGAYLTEYGHTTNPTEGDYSTGALDRYQGTIKFYCDPEPDFTRWQYWDSQITPGQQVVPELACIRLRGEWWIIDRDRERSMVQQVAALTVKDNPRHPIVSQYDVTVRPLRYV